MTGEKSTKRSLLLSGLALLMCFSMLIGSTYAWFTDSVTSGNTTIKTTDANGSWDGKCVTSGGTYTVIYQ